MYSFFDKFCFALMVIGLAIITGAGLFAILNSKTYTKEVFVYEKDGDNVTFIDSQGHLWKWEKENIFHLGQRIELTFDKNGTEEYIFDDAITEVKVIY